MTSAPNASSHDPAGLDQAAPLDSAAPSDQPQHQPHNFDVQKELHQRIRNDPDYDDWEYGTEPLPHEAWVDRSASGSTPGA